MSLHVYSQGKTSNSIATFSSSEKQKFLSLKFGVKGTQKKEKKKKSADNEKKQSGVKGTQKKEKKSADNEKEQSVVIERVVEVKKVGGKYRFHVKWRGYAETDNTWEPFTHLDSESQVIAKRMKMDYEAKHGTNKVCIFCVKRLFPVVSTIILLLSILNESSEERGWKTYDEKGMYLLCGRGRISYCCLNHHSCVIHTQRILRGRAMSLPKNAVNVR